MKKLWDKWKMVAEKIGDFQTKVVFTILYYLVIVPLGFVYKLIKKDPVSKDFSTWEKWEDTSCNIEKLHQQ